MIIAWEDIKNIIINGINNIVYDNKNGAFNANKKRLLSKILDNCHKYGCDHKIIKLNAKIYSRLIAPELIAVQPPMVGDSFALHTLRTVIDPQSCLLPDSMKNKLVTKTEMIAPFLNDYFTQPLDFSDDELIINKICEENDCEIITMLMNLKSYNDEYPTEVFSFNNIEIVSGPNIINDAGLKLSHMIKRQASIIRARTRRNVANWCIISPIALTILQSTSDIHLRSFFKQDQNHTDFALSGRIIYVGMIDGISVYCDKNAGDTAPIIVGYKGSDIDSGIFYTPSILLLIENGNYKKIDSYFLLENKEGYIAKATDYYGYVDMDVAQMVF